MASEFPLQVMYPGETVRCLQALESQDSLDAASVDTPAKNATRLQGSRTGGFYSFAGDFLGPWTNATYGAVVLSNRTGVDIDRDAAAEFLKTMQLQNGGFGPRLDFFGVDPIAARMASTADALWALQDLGELDDTIRNKANSFLQKKQTPQGGWPNFGGSIEPSTLGTFHALRALDAIDAASQRNYDTAAEYLKSLQADGGGFYAGDSPISCKPGCVDEPGGGIIFSQKGVSKDSAGQENCDREKDADPWTCDTNQQVVTTYSTSRAILGLARAGHLDTVDDLQQHANWLAERQLTDYEDPRFVGGFKDREGESFFFFPRDTTRLALRALAAMEAHGVTPSVEYDKQAAIDFVTKCQHGGTGGFGAWPSYVQSIRSTAGAMRALRDTGADAPATELAGTLAATQDKTYERDSQQNGAIPPQGWEWGVATTQTASGLLALSHAGETGDVDVGAAAAALASRQSKKNGGIKPADSSWANPDVRSTAMAVLALDAHDELDRIDQAAAGAYLANQQNSDEGYISAAFGPGYGRIADTSLSVRAAVALGEADQLDVGLVTDYLANQPAEGGEYWSGTTVAGQVVMGLDALGELDRIDTEATREYIESNQYSAGGFAGRGFYSGFTALERHAAAVSGLAILDGDVETTGTKTEGYSPAPSIDKVYGVAKRAPGVGMLNHRGVLVDPDELEK